MTQERLTLPADLFVSEAEVIAFQAKPPERVKGVRYFRRFDEAWIMSMLAADPPLHGAVWRLVAALLAEADFRKEIPITSAILASAHLNRKQGYRALGRLERLGLISLTRSGPGKALIAVPSRLGGRPRRR